MTPRPLALVTGASRGVGAAVARLLAPTHDLLLGGRDVPALEKIIEELPGAKAWPVELTDPAALAAATTGIDRLDVLVHSAGIAELSTVEDGSGDLWRRTLEVNLIAVAELTRLLLPALRAARGHVVLINSGAGQRANPGWSAYAASKFGLRAFADSLRAEEERNGLRICSVYPGRIDTDMQRAIHAATGEPYEGEKYLRPESVAKAVLAAVTATPDAHVQEITVRHIGG